MKYVINTTNGNIIEDKGNLGSSFRKDPFRTATQEEIDAFIEATEYRKKRLEEYPSIQEQLDMLYHDKDNGTDNWYEAIKAIKVKYPK